MPSETPAHIALVVGGTLSGVSVGLLFSAVVSRIRLGRIQRRSLATQERWLPYFIAAMRGEAPPVRPGFTWRTDSICVLSLWLSLRECMGGVAGERLVESLRATGLPSSVPKLMKNLDLRDRMLTVSMYGHLRMQDRWNELRKLLGGGSSLSLLAARSLVQIDPEAAVAEIDPWILKRKDWPAAGVAGILLSADRERVARCLLNKIEQDSEGELGHDAMVRLIGFLGVCNIKAAAPKLIERSERSRSALVRATAIRVLKDLGTRDVAVPAVRRALGDVSPVVRASAALALARLAEPEDESRLIEMLADHDAGVRYRAAQALAHLPSITLARYQEIHRSLPAGPAREVMAQVASEEVTTAATLDSLVHDSVTPDAKQLRRYFTHDNWRIRLQAMEVLLGERADQGHMADLVANERWWAKYESAKALARLPFVDEGTLKELTQLDTDTATRAVLIRATEECARGFE